MTESTVRRGRDTWVDSTNPNTPHGTGVWIRLQSGVKRGLVSLPIPTGTLGKTVSSAILTGHVHGSWSAQTLTVAALNENWDTPTWAHQPGVRAGTASVATGALTDGDEVVIDVADLVQEVADGAPHFGWRITTSAGTEQQLYSFDAAHVAWTLTIVTSDQPEAPTGLVPDGRVVGAAKPVVGFAPVDGMASLRVQIDPAADEISPDFDSAEVASTQPTLNLAATAYAGLAAGATTQWRAQVKVDGDWSDWSDWAEFTYRPLPTLTLDSPAGGVLWDPTSDVLAHISTTHLDAYRVRITAGNDRTKIRYDSGKLPADDVSDIAHALPERNNDGTRIFLDDRDYQLNVRAFDDYDREPTPGVPAYVEVWTTIHFDDDAALTPIASLTAQQVNHTPKIRLTWTRAAAADAWVVSRDGEVIARLDPEDTVTGPSTYSWVDKTARPNVKHIYAVRCLVDGTRSVTGPKAHVTTAIDGVWFTRSNGDQVRLDNTDVDQLITAERRATYKPLNVPYDVDIITGFEGISGPIVGTIAEDPDQAFLDAEAVLDAIKDNPSEVLQLMYGTVSVPVLVRNSTTLPHSTMLRSNLRHRVEVEVQQVGEFKHQVG